MKIILVRHGHPDYKKDCLTDLGHLQAQAAAQRLANSGIQRIFASPMGRAQETAAYTARKLSLEIETLDFMREISWRSVDGAEIPENGHPWNLADRFVEQNQPLTDELWTQTVPTSKVVVSGRDLIFTESDKWLEGLGYTREGNYYRVGENTDTTVALFSHGGSSTMLLSRMLNIPFIQLCAVLNPTFTAITEVSLSHETGTLTAPSLTLANDARHIEKLAVDNVFG